MGELTFFDNFYQRTLNSFSEIKKASPFKIDTIYGLIFSLEYSLYAAVIHIPLIIFLNTVLIPIIKNKTNNEHKSDLLLVFLLVIFMQTVITIITNSLTTIIADLPSIIEYKSSNKERQKQVETLRNSSVKQGISISSNILILPFLISIVQDIGFSTITWEQITNWIK